MITSMRLFNVIGAFLGVGLGDISRCSTLATNSSGLYNQRSGLEAAQLIKTQHKLMSLLKQHSIKAIRTILSDQI